MANTLDFLDRVTKYKSFLGHGSFGFVLKVQDKYKTNSCIKFIYPTDDDKQRVQNEREASIIVFLPKHEHIVTVKDSVCNKYLNPAQLKKIFSQCPNIIEAGWKDKPENIKALGWTCIQMKLCGQNLTTWLCDPETTMNSLFDQLKQTQIIKGLIYGLSFLHDRQIIHRDLKPANAMFTSEYRLPIKIGDFGQCRILSSSDNPTLTRSNIGTRTYTAPEVQSGKYSYQSDIFSLGLIIWEVIALIKQDEKRGLFDRLVNDGETDLVSEDHPLVGKIVKQLVINSTKKKVDERCKGMDDIGEIMEDWAPLQIPDKTLICRNGEELEVYLDMVPPNYTILLEEGIYQGRFEIIQNNLTIVGRGVENTLIFSLGDLTIFGNDCSISNLSIYTTKSNRRDVTFLGLTLTTRGLNPKLIGRGIVIYRNGCILSNINILRGSNGIQVLRSDVKIDRVKFTDIQYWCIELGYKSRNCTITDVTSENSRLGIIVHGTHHLLQRIAFEHVSISKDIYACGVYFMEGDKHTIEDSTFSGFGANSQWDIEMKSANTSAKNCTCYHVLVAGDGARLSHIESRDLIRIEEYPETVKLLKCKSKKLEAKGTVSMTDCDFASVKNINRVTRSNFLSGWFLK